MNELPVFARAGLNINFLAVFGSEVASCPIVVAVVVYKLVALSVINLITLAVASAFVPL